MIVSNSTKRVVYFNRNTKNIHLELFEFLNDKAIRSSSLKAHEVNISNFFLRPDRYQEVIQGITVIPPRTRWYFDGKYFHSLNSEIITSGYRNDLSEFINICQRLASVLKNKSVAIELSGGLDTSILIGLLRYFGIKPFLIGVKSNRYELRTESLIQEILSKSSNNVLFVDEDDALPFTELKLTPLHQIPSSSSLYFMHALSILKKCHEQKIDIIFSGMGFDTLLCESTKTIDNNSIPKNWFNWMLEDYWFMQNIYGKENVTYTSGAASQLIIKSIFALRKNQNEDLKKLWARNTFKEFLPTELVNYAYKADNSGGFVDGLLKAKSDISTLFEVAYSVTKFKEFDKFELKRIFHNPHMVDEKKDKLILSRVSFANWIYGLVRDNII